MCVWGNNDFVWLIAAQNHGQGVLDVFNDSKGENDQADSWKNRSVDYAGCLYNHANGRDPLKTMPKGGKDNNMFFADSDKTSSMRTDGAC